MRTIDEILADLEALLRFMPAEDARRVILLAQELSEAKALRLTGLLEQAREARDG